MGMSAWYGATDEEESIATIHRARELGIFFLDPEDNGVLETTRELGIGFIAYSPLGRGFLTGRFRSPDDLDDDDFRKHNPRFQGENFQRNLDLVERVQEIAREKGVTPAQLALA